MKQMILACAIGAALSGCADVDVLRTQAPGFDTESAAQRQLSFHLGSANRHPSDDNPTVTFADLMGQVSGGVAASSGTQSSTAQTPEASAPSTPQDTAPAHTGTPDVTPPPAAAPETAPPADPPAAPPETGAGPEEPGGGDPVPPATGGGKPDKKKDKKPNPSCEKSGGKAATC